MTLIKFKNPVLANQFDRMPYFSEMLNEFVNGWTSPDFRKSMVPAVNIKENEKSFDINLVAPGMKKDDFKIEVVDNLLTISAEVKQEEEEKTDRYTRKEFSSSSFTRSFKVSATGSKMASGSFRLRRCCDSEKPSHFLSTMTQGRSSMCLRSLALSVMIIGHLVSML